MTYSILYIVPEMISGGVEVNTLEFANYLSQKDYKISILTSQINMRHLINYKVNILLRDVKTKNPIKLILNALALVKFILKNNTDIVHVKSRAPAISVFLARKIIRKFYKKDFNFISTFHGLYGVDNYLKYKYATFMTKADIVIAVSERVENYIISNFCNLDKSKLFKINRGIDLTLYNIDKIPKDDIITTSKALGIDQDPSKKILLFPGRLSKNKGHLWLIEALSKLKRDDYICVIATGSSEESDLYKEIIDSIEKFQLNERVRIIFKIKNIKAAYMLSHISMSLSTKEESFGRVPIEAAALGIPCLATNMGTFKMTIIDNYSGWLVNSGNIKELTDKINAILDISDDEITEIGKKAREFIEQNYNILNTFFETEELYKNLINS